MTLALLVLGVASANAAQKMYVITAGQWQGFNLIKADITAADYKGFRLEYEQLKGKNSNGEDGTPIFQLCVSSKETHLGKDWKGDDAQVPNRTQYYNDGFTPANSVFEGNFDDFVDTGDPETTCPTISSILLQSCYADNSIILKKFVLIKQDDSEVEPEYGGAGWNCTAEEYDPSLTFTDIITNGDLEGNGNVNFTMTEQGVGGPFIAKIQDGIGKDGSRGIAVQSSDNPTQDWDTQFFISVPKKLATGTKFKVTFDCKASQAATGDTQWHNAPGDYVFWGCVNSVSFTTSWETIERTVTVSQNDKDEDIAPYTIAFNLAKTKTATTYYFDNIKLEVLDDQLAGLTAAPALTNDPYPSDPAFTVGEAGYATFGYDAPVVFGDDVEAYAAVYNAGGFVELTQLAGAAKNTAVVLKAAPGNYTAKVQNVAAPAANDLQVSDGNVAGDGTIYVLANKAQGVGFYKLASGDKVPAGKAYLTIGGTPAPDFLGFDGGTTSINELNVKGQADGTYFNLAGQRVAQPTKGLYIVNGKKVIK